MKISKQSWHFRLIVSTFSKARAINYGSPMGACHYWLLVLWSMLITASMFTIACGAILVIVGSSIYGIYTSGYLLYEAFNVFVLGHTWSITEDEMDKTVPFTLIIVTIIGGFIINKLYTSTKNLIQKTIQKRKTKTICNLVEFYNENS